MELDNPNPETVDNVLKGFEVYKERISLMFLGEGPQDEVWVQRIEWSAQNRVVVLRHPFEQGTWPTDVFSADGQYRGRMMLPFAPRHQKMVGEYLYGIGQTPGGAPALIRYRLEPME